MIIKPVRFVRDTRKIKITERVHNDNFMHNTWYFVHSIIVYKQLHNT